MLNVIAWVSLILCILNWLLFLGLTFLNDMPELKRVVDALVNPPPAPAPSGLGVTVQHAAVDPVKLASATGSLAGAFKKAGPAPTAAALSVMFMLVALIAAGVEKL
jgi:hypothetical protein